LKIHQSNPMLHWIKRTCGDSKNHLWLCHATWPITGSFVAQTIFTFYLLLTEAKCLRFPLMLSASAFRFRFLLLLSASAFRFLLLPKP
jgi:hypothetical protein